MIPQIAFVIRTIISQIPNMQNPHTKKKQKQNEKKKKQM